MPWEVKDRMSLIQEFVLLASQEGAKIASLCRRFNISRKTAYKWLARYQEHGLAGLEARSSRPRSSPKKTIPSVAEVVVSLRQAHPTWGGRKLKARLEALQVEDIPACSTITDILRREGLIDAKESAKHKPFIRFEHEAPNSLWQMDFKGHFQTGACRCHPLTVLDDHSRFSLCLAALRDEQGHSVEQALTKVFRLYGLPLRMTMDNGNPWGTSGGEQVHTRFTVWLMQLGIYVGHSRPKHPQTQGKDERFHRTLGEELIVRTDFRNIEDCQARFDRWREIYNTERPHEALGLAVPASRYQPSSRAFPEALPPVEYLTGDVVRKVQGKGEISYRGRVFKVGRAFSGQPVALRPSEVDGILEVYFCAQRVAEIDLRQNIQV